MLLSPELSFDSYIFSESFDYRAATTAGYPDSPLSVSSECGSSFIPNQSVLFDTFGSDDLYSSTERHFNSDMETGKHSAERDQSASFPFILLPFLSPDRHHACSHVRGNISHPASYEEVLFPSRNSALDSKTTKSSKCPSRKLKFGNMEPPSVASRRRCTINSACQELKSILGLSSHCTKLETINYVIDIITAHKQEMNPLYNKN